MNKKPKVFKTRFSVDVTDDVNEQLQLLAAKNIKGTSRAEVVRAMIEESLGNNGITDQEQLVRKIIRQELDNKLEGYLKRIVSISVKGSITSSAAYFLSAIALSDFVRPDLQADFDQAVKQAKQMAISYVGLQDDTINDFLATGLEQIRRKLDKGGTSYSG